jgi:hypothetical protein
MTSTFTAISAEPATGLSVTYDGPALAAGRMDVRVLASAMASVAQLVEDSARLIYGNDADVRIEVSGDFRTGSFTYQNLATALSGLTTEQLRELLTWLGLIAAPTGLTVMGVLKWLAGKKPSRVTRDGDTAIIVSGNDNRVVNLHVAQLVLNHSVRTGIEGMTQPLAEAGIEVMKVGETATSTAVEITADERPAFLAPPPAAETLHDGEAIAVLQIVSPVFRLGNKWQFSHPGEPSFYAPILDRAFLQRFKNREIALLFGDLVRVRMRTAVTRTEAGSLSTTREILEVLEVIPPPKQVDMFEPPDGAPSS